MNELGIFFDNVLVIVFKVILDEKDSLNIRLEIEFIGKFFSFFFFSKDFSILIGDLRDGVVINISNLLERRNNSFLIEFVRRFLFDLEFVCEKVVLKLC